MGCVRCAATCRDQRSGERGYVRNTGGRSWNEDRIVVDSGKRVE